MKLNKTEKLLLDRVDYCPIAEKKLAYCVNHREVMAGISLERKGLVRYEYCGERINGIHHPGAIIYPV